jgi:hypothetical protein
MRSSVAVTLVIAASVSALATGTLHGRDKDICGRVHDRCKNSDSACCQDSNGYAWCDSDSGEVKFVNCSMWGDGYYCTVDPRVNTPFCNDE